MVNHQVNVNPGELVSAAADLDTLADRLEAAMGGSDLALSTPPAGRDEVSMVAAGSFTGVTDEFRGNVAGGVLELRKIAATLRAQASGYLRVDDEVSATLRA